MDSVNSMNTMNTNAASTRGILGFHLKMIAVISMLIDHLGATVVYGFLLAAVGRGKYVAGINAFTDWIVTWVVNNWDLAYGIYEAMRTVGRIAFPIYCFLIVEGFLHTRSVGKYALRLGIFALISEIPFDLAFNEGWHDSSSNNVFFTLLIGLMVIWGISYAKKWYEEWIQKNGNVVLGRVLEVAAVILVAAAGGFTAEYLLHTDYGAAGVATIAVMYLLRRKPWQGFLIAVLVLTLMTNSSELVALIGAVFVCYYSGERGKNMKYFFYAFYPVHLLLLWFITVMLGI